MNSFTFKKIIAKNFYSIDNLEFDIEHGNFLVTGKVGSGKSSLFEIVVWTFFKLEYRSSDPSKNYKGDAFTSVEFFKNKDYYKVTRNIKNGILGNKIEIIKNEQNITPRKHRDAEKALAGIIGMEQEVFINTIVVLQGLPNNFSKLTPVSRKSIIEFLLNFSVWDTFKKKFLDYHKIVDQDLSSIEEKYSSSKTQMVELNSRVETLKEVKQEQTIDLVETKKKIREINESLSIVEQEKQKYSKILNEVDAFQQALKTSKRKKLEIESALKDTVCSECGQVLPKEQIDTLKKKVCFIENKILTINNKIGPLEKNLEVFDFSGETPLIEERATLQNDLQNFVKEKEKFNIIELQKELDELVSETNSLQEELDLVKVDLDALKFLEDTLLPSSKFRTHVLTKYLNLINATINTVAPLLLEDTQVKLIIDSSQKGIDISIKKSKKDIKYLSLSGGQKRLVDICLIISFQKYLIDSSPIKSNLIVFDEIFDALDNDSIVKVVNCILNIFSEYQSLYVITHNTSIKSLFTRVIKVSLEEGATKVLI